jgi:hypothetical protein
MKKTKFLAVFAGIISALPCAGNAAYPVYNPQQLARQGYVINTYPQQQQIVRPTTGYVYNPQQMAGRTNITP